ncbi:MAG: site-2 protease family protein [Trueperaceae bacterium]|nr:site-2 protease family protein [Trueperaceae bacterium]
MILRYLNDPTTLVIAAIVMLFALMFHNVFQTWVAARLGDNAPRLGGYGAFEPQQQLEPIGVALLFLLGFGWPRMVPIQSRNYRPRSREAFAWYAGPLAYLMVGFVCVLIGSVFLSTGSPDLYRSFLIAAAFAVLHAVINLFPVFPLDGAMAALAWGNPSVRRFMEQIRGFGILGFLVVFLVLSYTGVIGALQGIFLNLFQAIIGLIPGL